MTAFDDRFTAAAAPRLLEQHGEEFVYWPAGGLPRNITGLVNRNPPEAITPEGLVGTLVTISVTATEALGVLSDQVDSGGDQVEIALRAGGEPERRPVVRVASDDGMITLWVK